MEQDENYPSILHLFVIKVLSLEGVMSTKHYKHYKDFPCVMTAGASLAYHTILKVVSSKQ